MNIDMLNRLLSTSPAGGLDELEAVARKHDVLRFFTSRSAVDQIVEVCGNAYPSWNEQTPLASAAGVVAVPVVIEHRQRLPMAAEAAVLPVKWTADAENEGVLPPGLSQLAKQVLGHARQSPRLRDQYRTELDRPWRLAWTLSSWQDVDLSALPLSPESAYAPLGIGLVSALAKVPLSRDFFCTGQWDAATRRWSVNNQTLQRKLSAAVDLGFRRFVVPARSRQTLENFLKQQAFAPGTVHQAVLHDDCDLDAAFNDARVVAGSPPRVTDLAEDRERWYDSIRDEPSARRFYESHLMPSACDNAIKHLRESGLRDWRPDTLISVVSHSYELIKLAGLTFRPKQLVLIHTGGESGSAIYRALDDLMNWCDQDVQRPVYQDPLTTEVVDGVESLDQIVKIVSAVTRCTAGSSGQSGVLIDVTPGKRTMILGMLQAARQGDRVLCWWHDTAPHNRRPKPLSVQPLIWEVQVSGGLLPLCPPIGSAGAEHERK